MVRVVGSVLVLVALLSPAFAADDVATARAHYEKGKHAFDVGRYVEAAHEFELAYDAKDDPALLLNMGQAYRLAGDYPRAVNAYRAFLRNDPNAPNAEELRARIREMQLVIERQAQAAQDAGRAPAPVPPTTAPTTQAAAPADQPAPRWYHNGFLALVGAGVASVAVGAGLLAHGLSLEDDSRNATSLQAHYDLHSQAGYYQAPGIAVLAAGGAMIVAGAVIVAVEQRRATKSVRGGVGAAPGGAFVSVGGAL